MKNKNFSNSFSSEEEEIFQEEEPVIEEQKIEEKFVVSASKKEYTVLSIVKGNITLTDGQNSISIPFESKYKDLKVGDKTKI